MLKTKYDQQRSTASSAVRRVFWHILQVLHKRDTIALRLKIQKAQHKTPIMSAIHHITPKTFRQRTAIFAMAVVFAAVGVGIPMARADQYQEQIDALKQQTAESRQSLDQLGAQADSYQDQINKLQAEINSLQEQIQVNQAKSADLQRQIVEAEAELARQKKVLGQSIKQMYLEGQISTIEMLASSKDLSEFVDKQQYRDSVQNKIKTTLDKITALKLQLKDQKDQVEKLLKDLETMKAQLGTQQAEQSRLLSMNQQQQRDLDSQIKANNSKVAELRAQQAAAIAAAARSRGVQIVPSTGNGGYPDRWANASPDSMVDSWGMYNRECVSFTAFKVWQSGRYMPYWGGRGNANEWPGNARAAGIPVDSRPRVGDVAILYIGVYGHAMYVEAVLDSGAKVMVSQYNWAPYAYNEMILSTSGMEFIHF